MGLRSHDHAKKEGGDLLLEFLNSALNVSDSHGFVLASARISAAIDAVVAEIQKISDTSDR